MVWVLAFVHLTLQAGLCNHSSAEQQEARPARCNAGALQGSSTADRQHRKSTAANAGPPCSLQFTAAHFPPLAEFIWARYFTLKPKVYHYHLLNTVSHFKNPSPLASCYVWCSLFQLILITCLQSAYGSPLESHLAAAAKQGNWVFELASFNAKPFCTFHAEKLMCFLSFSEK